MGKGEKTAATAEQVPVDLEPYRRLIEIQKQLVRMAEQHEQSRRECDVLRQQVAREMEALRHVKSGMRHRLRQSASRVFKRFSSLSRIEASYRTLKSKLPFLC